MKVRIDKVRNSYLYYTRVWATKACDTTHMGGIGRTLVIAGIVLVLLGLVISLGDRLPIRLGRLPGDIQWRGKNSVFYFPVVTSLLLSVVVSLVIWLFNRLR
jgi:hypothetical protein